MIPAGNSKALLHQVATGRSEATYPLHISESGFGRVIPLCAGLATTWQPRRTLIPGAGKPVVALDGAIRLGRLLIRSCRPPRKFSATRVQRRTMASFEYQWMLFVT